MKRSVGSRPAAFSILMVPKYLFREGVHTDDRLARVADVWAHHTPEALQRRVSLVLVMRTQVQPVSLQTRSSPAPGAP